MLNLVSSLLDYAGAALLTLAVILLRVLWVTGHLLFFCIGIYLVYKLARLVWSVSQMTLEELDDWIKT